jgi:uncharacterized protein (TIGR02145 family)
MQIKAGKARLILAVSWFSLACTIGSVSPVGAAEGTGPTTVVSSVSPSIVEAPRSSTVAEPSFGSMTDPRDKKTYKTVVIGSQTWMAENLNFTTKKGSYAFHKEEKNTETYGRLYYWETAMDKSKSSNAVPSAVQGVCPGGWHLPSDAEWGVLENYLGGAAVAGGKMKEVGNAHWVAPNTGAENSSGFTALPGGFNNFIYNGLGTAGCFWSSTEGASNMAWVHILTNTSAGVDRYNYGKSGAYSVRCLQN